MTIQLVKTIDGNFKPCNHIRVNVRAGKWQCRLCKKVWIFL